MADNVIDYTENGERDIPTRPGYVYQALLSLYHQALPFMSKGARVLDAGCGAGYGSSFLLEQGASEVTGVDLSAVAIEFCQQNYAKPGLNFRQLDLGEPLPFGDRSFDFIFSSNAMEHVGAIDLHLNECRRLLTGSGRIYVAVPAIIDPVSLEANIRNVFHVTNLTPLGWFTKIGRYFEVVRAFRHWPIGETGGWPAVMAKVALEPAQCTTEPSDFFIEEGEIERLNLEAENLNTVLVAARPRERVLAPHIDEYIPHTWAEGAIQARVRRELG